MQGRTAESVRIGYPAPDFELRDQFGQSVRLSSVRAEGPVVVMFYPSAFSRVCSDELGAVRDLMPQWQSDGLRLLAISCDPMFSLRAFAERERLGFPLLSDFWPHGAVASAYGVFDEVSGVAGRATFAVDPAGSVRWMAHHDVTRRRDLSEQLSAAAALLGTPSPTK